MAEPQSTPDKMTAEAFFEWAITQPEGRRYELVDGEIFAMAPERNRHNLAKVEALIALRNAVRSGNLQCTVLGDGATVIIDEDTVYEPDVTVQCGGTIDLNAVTVDRPTIVVEVLSPSTGAIDTGKKLGDYFRIDSVQHYLILDPGARRVIHHSRDGHRIATTILMEGTLVLHPPGITVPVSDLFPQP